MAVGVPAVAVGVGVTVGVGVGVGVTVGVGVGVVLAVVGTCDGLKLVPEGLGLTVRTPVADGDAVRDGLTV